ncbi:MAG: twin-arginine translocase subunit TatC [Corynebacterium sp.]|uniref:twin-arginine translocase subunit TatC n=1 Tax=unclassified Corynebacterium TaxID=2624378 RepID=UPI0026490E12|nr:twin-arginine translocase subunit TatC [Corynebacterium sp.]MDN5580943.1 twin-arginine translocase subunit TatC [Corynebacterium sp.]MDN5719254.1 twin-arginine translocase subunit TatC [Corynebacterium sp.]
MSLVEHLKELRRRVLVALAAIAVGTVLGYMWYGNGVFGTPSLGELLKEPYCDLPDHLRFGSETNRCALIATAPFDMFMLRLKIGFIAGLVLSAPVWLGQLWGFITPGLKKNEKKWTRIFVTAATLLFVIGAVLAYFVLSFGLEFLVTMGGETQVAALTGDRYFNFLLMLLLVFGISFEFPLIMVMLNVLGILSYESLKDKRRYIILGLFIFAAIATPGGDPVSMLILSMSMCLMMEIAIQITRLNDKRRAKNAGVDGLGGLPEDLDDESASSIAPAAPLATPRATAAPTPTKPAANPTAHTSTTTRMDQNNLDDLL